MVSEDAVSPLQEARSHYQPRVPPLLKTLSQIALKRESLPNESAGTSEKLFPHLGIQPLVRLIQGSEVERPLPRRVGIVFSGGQAPGGHNVIAGLYDALKQRNPASRLFGFLNGPGGLLGNLDYLEIHEHELAKYRNCGGFDLLGSGRTKIESPEQLEAAKKMVWALELHALVIVGGDDSNTIAATMAEYFLADKVPCQVIGVPKTIDGDLSNHYIELSFGFDTACKTYSETIGSIGRDTLSAKKSYYFIKMMGRSASHVTLECAMQTHPNLALIGEDMAARKATLEQVTLEIADVICQRAEQGKHYGVILIPEGIIEFMRDCRLLFDGMNSLGTPDLSVEVLIAKLSPEALECFQKFPEGSPESTSLRSRSARQCASL